METITKKVTDRDYTSKGLLLTKKVTGRDYTSKGLLLTFEDNTYCILPSETINCMKGLEVPIPRPGDSVSVKPSSDVNGILSDKWFKIAA